MEPKVFCSHSKMVPIEQIKENPGNPNVHPKEQIEILGQVLANGWRLPITISNRSGMIVRGHGRFMAAKKIGCKVVPVDYQDYDSNEDELADLLADNKLPELSFMDTEKTNKLLNDLIEKQFDISMAGFTPVDLEKIMGDMDKLIDQDVSDDKNKSMGKKQFQIKPVLYIEQVSILEKAIVKTGAVNRGEAIMKICEAYLNG